MTASGTRSILVLNVGSSTLKFGLYPIAEGDEPSLRGSIGYSRASKGGLTITDGDGKDRSSNDIDANPESAPGELLRYLQRESLLGSIDVVGHRLVHGGSQLREPVAINSEIRLLLERLVPLAPDHLPLELRAIDEITRLAPDLVQIACFDTAFHSTMPFVAKLFGLPRAVSDSGVVRYGFHGLSYEYIVEALRTSGDLPHRTVVAHLGNGASIAALLDGKSVDTSMGMTPAGGIVMGTRSGDLDPGVLLYLLRSDNFSTADLNRAVNENGGLLGISDSSSDVRALLAASPTDRRAEEAIDIFCYQARKFIGGYAAALGGIDALVFTGGIGEHSHEIRKRICEHLGFLGVRLDAGANELNASTISTADSEVRVYAIRTNEEAMIARHVRAALRFAPPAGAAPR